MKKILNGYEINGKRNENVTIKNDTWFYVVDFYHIGTFRMMIFDVDDMKNPTKIMYFNNVDEFVNEFDLHFEFGIVESVMNYFGFYCESEIDINFNANEYISNGEFF